MKDSAAARRWLHVVTGRGDKRTMLPNNQTITRTEGAGLETRTASLTSVMGVVFLYSTNDFTEERVVNSSFL